MKYPDWHKHFREIELVALKGATTQARSLYNYLRVWSPGTEAEPVTDVTYEQIQEDLRIGPATVKKSVDWLVKRKLIEKVPGAGKKDGLKFQFIFDYPGSTIKVISGRILISTTEQKQRKDDLTSGEKYSTSAQKRSTSEQKQLPYIEIEREYMIMLRNKIVDKLNELKIFERIYNPVIDDDFGIRFVADVLRRHPNATGPEIRIKITDGKNRSEYGVIDLFYKEASRMPQEALLVDSKTGDEGVWRWHGNHGEIHIEHTDKQSETVKVNTLGQFRRWEKVQG